MARFVTRKIKEMEKELMKFVESLQNRGLLSKSMDEMDYEWVVWDYIRSKKLSS